MSKSIVVFPKRVRLVLNPDRHTVGVAKRWAEPYSLAGNVKAVLAPNRKVAETVVLDNVRVFMGNFPDVRDGFVKLGDLVLEFEASAVDQFPDGTFAFYGPGSVSQESRLGSA